MCNEGGAWSMEHGPATKPRWSLRNPWAVTASGASASYSYRNTLAAEGTAFLKSSLDARPLSRLRNPGNS
jgi:hypothetical protein